MKTDYNKLIEEARIASANGNQSKMNEAIRILASALDQLACYKENADAAIDAAIAAEKVMHGGVAVDNETV